MSPREIIKGWEDMPRSEQLSVIGMLAFYVFAGIVIGMALAGL
jgi:hypothetical protein